jgi:hypothetical protein
MLEGTTLFGARLWVAAPTSSGYRLALSNDNSITDNDGEVFSSDLSFGTTYRVVTKYEYDNPDAMLWINPLTEASASVTATDPAFSDEFAAYAFRQAAGNTMQVIDNLVVADNFQEALTGEAVIPEPTSACLVMLAGLALVGVRSRRVR